MEKNGQTVTVLDGQGAVIGYTYPKRAKGLVKKCRAEFVSDYEIRLYRQFPTYENMEENAMNENDIQYLYFNAREWHDHHDAGNFNIKTPWSRFFINSPFDGKLTEIMSVGSWEWDRRTVASTDIITLTPDTTYYFVFWLNGGENDRSDETCQLKVIFPAERYVLSAKDEESALIYPLNRGYIKPVKKYKGWELYSIPFETGKSGLVCLQFWADRAPMAVMHAECPEAYDQLEDITDQFEGMRPQRHNIFFEDGWPAGEQKWYSTACLQKRAQGTDTPKSHFGQMPDFPGLSNLFRQFNPSGSYNLSEVDDKIRELNDLMSDLEDVQDNLETLLGNFEEMRDRAEETQEES